MYGNFKIKYQSELEKLPYFTKQTAGMLMEKEGVNLDRKIERLTAAEYYLRLKKGLYTTRPYVLSCNNQEQYAASLVPVLCVPAYLSLEYVLSSEGLIPEAIRSYTAITTKSTRTFTNFLGRFDYKNINERLFFGFQNARATKVKALFDLLYLKSNLGTNVKKELSDGLRINWANVSARDLLEFDRYVEMSKSGKMAGIGEILKGIIK